LIKPFWILPQSINYDELINLTCQAEFETIFHD
jgi:hypothetical protein